MSQHEADLHKNRRETAELEFQQYDFWGSPPYHSAGWVSEEQDVLHRELGFHIPGEEGTLMGQFTIKFEPESVEVVDVVATCDGETLGNRGEVSPSPRP